MRAAATLLILAIAACAALASHQHKPFELRVDGNLPVVEHERTA